MDSNFTQKDLEVENPCYVVLSIKLINFVLYSAEKLWVKNREGILNFYVTDCILYTVDPAFIPLVHEYVMTLFGCFIIRDKVFYTLEKDFYH